MPPGSGFQRVGESSRENSGSARAAASPDTVNRQATCASWGAHWRLAHLQLCPRQEGAAPVLSLTHQHLTPSRPLTCQEQKQGKGRRRATGGSDSARPRFSPFCVFLP